MKPQGQTGLSPRIFRLFRPTLLTVACLCTLALLIDAAAASPATSIPLFYSVGTPPDGRGELDSVALWVGPNATSALLFITDKLFDSVEIHNAVTNTYVGRLGTSGSGTGQMARPNGVVVGHGLPTSIGPRDMVFVAERDNNRVSAWLIPYMYPLGDFGAGEISQPYGVTYHLDNGVPQVWVTSTGYTPQRVQIYDVGWDAQTGLQATLNRWFAVPGSSVLETIVVDPVSQRVLVCDEGSFDIMVFDFDGILLRRFGTGDFTDDPEGMAIYDTGNGTGYIVVSDQVSSPMEFEVFDRQTYERIGAFTGVTAGTDGLTLTQAPLPNLPNGSLFAVHSDASLHSYDWADIAAEMGLCVNDCETSDTQAELAPRKSGILSSLPNPFNPTTTIRYRVSREGPVVLSIFDLQGRLVRTLLDANKAPGDHQEIWRGQDDAGRTASAGIYFVQMISAAGVSTHKVILVK